MIKYPPKRRYSLLTAVAAAGLLGVLYAGCGELKQPSPKTFYSETDPPQNQEFRWSNGKPPRSFDPAQAAAPPETDIVRAVFEGLTGTDPKTLKAVPAVAASWKATEGGRVWTFTLRRDASWSNGEKVTAQDFVRSWARLAAMGDNAPLHFLLHNIKGIHATQKAVGDRKPKPEIKDSKAGSIELLNPNIIAKNAQNEAVQDPGLAEKISEALRVEATGRFELRVTLLEPDEEFPTLVAHPIFRPVYGNGDYFAENPLSANIVTNGAFRIASVGREGVTLDREERYFDRERVKLARVIFVPSKDADSALAAYKAGEVDAVTNTEFEPLALKILTPFVDFKRTTHSALNFYQFNLASAPFNDRRVREALAISIDRERLSEGELEGAAHPAFDYLPFDVGREIKLRPDVEKARTLLETAGFPGGNEFPVIRLLINRNNTQEKIARSVAKMWKSALNIETELLIMDPEEMQEASLAGAYDLIRRGVVLPTADETANMLAIFSSESHLNKRKATSDAKPKLDGADSRVTPPTLDSNPNTDPEELLIDRGMAATKVMTEAEAIAAIPAIPLYFPTSYSLVKPYVNGFQMNTLDAPALKNVFIDNSWQPGNRRRQS